MGTPSSPRTTKCAAYYDEAARMEALPTTSEDGERARSHVRQQ